MSLTVTPDPAKLGSSITAAFAFTGHGRYAVLVLVGDESLPNAMRDLDWRYLNGTTSPPSAPVATGTVAFQLPAAQPVGRWAVQAVDFTQGPFQGQGVVLPRTGFVVGPAITPTPTPVPVPPGTGYIDALEAAAAKYHNLTVAQVRKALTP